MSAQGAGMPLYRKYKISWEHIEGLPSIICIQLPMFTVIITEKKDIP